MKERKFKWNSTGGKMQGKSKRNLMLKAPPMMMITQKAKRQGQRFTNALNSLRSHKF